MSDKAAEDDAASISVAADNINLRIEEKFCQKVQTRINEVKFQSEHQNLQTTYEISNAFSTISVFLRSRLNEIDTETV